MKWVPVHDRVKYFSLLHPNIVFRAYTASCKSVGGADSLRWMLYTHVQLVLKIMLLFHAHFLVLEIPLIWTTTQSTSASAIFYHCSLLNTQSTLFWEWQKIEYFEILYDKWRIFCKALNVYTRFSEDIMNAMVMCHHFLHEIEYCNSEPYIIPLGVVTFHWNYASKICHHSFKLFLQRCSRHSTTVP